MRHESVILDLIEGSWAMNDCCIPELYKKGVTVSCGFADGCRKLGDPPAAVLAAVAAGDELVTHRGDGTRRVFIDDERVWEVCELRLGEWLHGEGYHLTVWGLGLHTWKK